MPCLRCGKCCDGIGLTANMKHVRTSGHSDKYFIMKNWREVPLSKASRLNPRLREAGIRRYFEGFFVCSKYDKKNKSCTVQGTKPYVCSGYPFYSSEKSLESKAGTILDEGCGYELERERFRLIITIKDILNRREYETRDNDLSVLQRDLEKMQLRGLGVQEGREERDLQQMQKLDDESGGRKEELTEEARPELLEQ